MKAARHEEERAEHEERKRGGHVSAKEEREEKKERHEKRARGGAMPMTGPSPIHNKKDRGHEKVTVTKKRGGKVEGEKARHHLGRRARGGRMTPASPFSGAGEGGKMPYVNEHKASDRLEAKIKQPVRGQGADKTGPYAGR